MKTQAYGLSNQFELQPSTATGNQWAQASPLVGGARERQDAAPESALGNYIANRGNGVKSDSPSRDLPVDGTWSWQKSETNYFYHLHYDEGPGDRAWMEERDRNYLARLEHEKQAKEQAEQQQQQIEEKERELEARNSELEQERQRRAEKERELEAKNLELEQEQQQRAEKERELEAKNLELEQEQQQRAEKERELEAKNSELLHERQQRVEKEKELEARNLELGQERQRRTEKERELEVRNLELEQERQQRAEKERELEATQSKLKTARSALLPTIPNDTVTKEEVFLAKGSYGKVYRGEWLGETIALKELINSELTDDAITEFKEEAFKMAHLRSPYVVTVYGITLNAQGRLQGIVMEYMPQGSLYKILSNREIPLSWLVRHKMALTVAQGLSFLHQQNIIHNDLKSLNVLVHHHGAKWKLKLTDFGLSKIKQETAIFTNTPQGTPAWMAPELFEQNSYSKASDVYAYGIVLWEIVSRQKPFSDKKPIQIMRLVCDRKERPLIPTAAPSSLVTLMGLCWKQNRANRLLAEDVITQLEALPLKQELRGFDDKDDARGEPQKQRVDGNVSPQWSM